jgi:hypothetical protein
VSGDTKADCEALAGLFLGALNRFRNPSAHTKRTFDDVFEAMEELMFASRLLRLVDARKCISCTTEGLLDAFAWIFPASCSSAAGRRNIAIAALSHFRAADLMGV